MNDVVPFAGSWRQMVDNDIDLEFIGQPLQFAIPKSNPRTIDAATVCGDRQAFGVRVSDGPIRATSGGSSGPRISVASWLMPTLTPTGIAGNIVDAITCCPVKK